MEKWEIFLNRIRGQNDDPSVLKQIAGENFEKYNIYVESIQKLNGTLFFIARRKTEKALVIYGSKEYWPLFIGKEKKVSGGSALICGLDHENCAVIRKLFYYTNPVSRGERSFSMGLGDRLGIATPGHIRTIIDLDVFPILAQQSVRELNLTGRTFGGVLDDACWGVFQEGYKKGFGADADHLKTKEEVKLGLGCGYSMITLDCSGYIDNRYFDMDEEALSACYEKLPDPYRNGMEAEYLTGAQKTDEGTSIEFSKAELMRNVLVYGPTIDFIESIYRELIIPCERKVDFEVSIDETTVPTTPEAHYFIALELKKRGVKAGNIAPRFYGEFQKGIDYIGNVREFEEQLIVHEKIAEHFGYRLSIHSGSDKFKVFPSIGKHTKLNVHVKTAGTNWLESLRVIAEKNPELFRRIVRFAIDNIAEAKKYYRVKADVDTLPDIDKMEDWDLAGLLVNEDSRQILHITYGLILQEKNKEGGYVFRDDIYKTLYKYEDEYYSRLIKHIGEHLKKLGVS